MKLYRIIVQLLLAMLVLLAGSLANGTEVVLYPGYIEGSVTTALPGYTAKNIHVTASGGGYSSSNNVALSDNYALTVQTGDWNTEVSVSDSRSGRRNLSEYQPELFTPDCCC